MIVTKSKAQGSCFAPPSKSMDHRYLIAAALSSQKTTVKNIAYSQDIKATLQCLNSMGIDFTANKDSIDFSGNNKSIESDEITFDCNESGSTLRFFIPIALTLNKKAKFLGSETLIHRPMTVYEDICKQQNISFGIEGNSIKTEGTLKADTFIIPGNISSQFITGLLFALPLLCGDSVLKIKNKFESRSYVEMTLMVLKEFGIEVKWLNKKTLFIKGNQKYNSTESTVEGDYSNTAFFEAFNTLDGNVTIEGLREDSLQGDKVYVEYYKALCKKKAHLDISNCPDLGPILFVVAALHNGGIFKGTKRLQIKESNRGVVMQQELSKFGVDMKVYNNKIVINKSQIHSPTQIIDGHNDHRIVMSMVTMLSQTGGRIEGIQAVRKSLPDYFIRIKKLGIQFQTENEEEVKLLEEQK
ncbi:MAG: hypothetical protein MJ179_10015 [Treponema sp.]|nr:hypothetical protein [Treponema sp.]